MGWGGLWKKDVYNLPVSRRTWGCVWCCWISHQSIVPFMNVDGRWGRAWCRWFVIVCLQSPVFNLVIGIVRLGRRLNVDKGDRCARSSTVVLFFWQNFHALHLTIPGTSRKSGLRLHKGNLHLPWTVVGDNIHLLLRDFFIWELQFSGYITYRYVLQSHECNGRVNIKVKKQKIHEFGHLLMNQSTAIIFCNSLSRNL